jgi:hypothetical protein
MEWTCVVQEELFPCTNEILTIMVFPATDYAAELRLRWWLSYSKCRFGPSHENEIEVLLSTATPGLINIQRCKTILPSRFLVARTKTRQAVYHSLHRRMVL